MTSEFRSAMKKIEAKSWRDKVLIKILLWLDYESLYDKWCWMYVRRMCSIG